jgi:hypothetical protein
MKHEVQMTINDTERSEAIEAKQLTNNDAKQITINDTEQREANHTQPSGG